MRTFLENLYLALVLYVILGFMLAGFAMMIGGPPNAGRMLRQYFLSVPWRLIIFIKNMLRSLFRSR